MNAQQVKALIKAHMEGDAERFCAVGLQIAAAQAHRGNTRLAREIEVLVKPTKTGRVPMQRAALSSTCKEMVFESHPDTTLADMSLDEILGGQLRRVLREQRHAERLRAHGLAPRRKLLLYGPPGTGKTMSAGMLAAELELPLFEVRLDGVIRSHLGETSEKLRKVFDAMSAVRGVYFFDEFDALGAQRARGNDVGEMSRVLGSLLGMIEQEDSTSLIIAATNHPDVLDHALWRRFDDVLHYALPDRARSEALLRSRLGQMAAEGVSWPRLAQAAEGMSCADITQACTEVCKDVVMGETEAASEPGILARFEQRREMAQRFRPPG